MRQFVHMTIDRRELGAQELHDGRVVTAYDQHVHTRAQSMVLERAHGAHRHAVSLMKQTGADIHCIGDGGFAGCSSPENVQQLSFSIKGKPYTYYRMASVNR